MPVGSKFAHLWLEESSPSSSDETSPNHDLKDKDEETALKLTMDFIKSMDQESLEYLRRDYETTDLFASFGYDTSFGGVGQLEGSPKAAKNNTGVVERPFGSPSSSWQDLVSRGSSYPTVSEPTNATLGTVAGAEQCQSFNQRKSDGDSLHSGHLNGGVNGHSPYDSKCGTSGSVSTFDSPLLTSSPVRPQASSLEMDSQFSSNSLLPPGSGHYDSIVQALTHIASQLEDNESEHLNVSATGSSPRTPWNNPPKHHGLTNISTETMQKWIKVLRNIQDTLTYAVDMDCSQRAQMCELTCTLQKQILHNLMGMDSSNASKACFSVPVTSDIYHERQIQAAKFLREHSGFLPQSPSTWRGVLPGRDYQNAVFSCKVFLGGLPYDMTEAGMIQAFRPFGNVKVEWPGKEMNPLQHKGYAYIIFENEKQVKIMLHNCTRDYTQDGRWFCKMSSRRVRMKDVEVIPWALSDSNFALRPSSKLEPQLTIFVGALHGMLNAEGLAIVMEDTFGGVVHAGIDTDRNKYPIGSGRVSFDNYHSYFTAIHGAFVEIKSSKFEKIVQVDPYLEDSNCSHCSLQQAPYFCRNFDCFRYYCRTCFELAHASESLRSHRPLMRNPNKKSLSSGGFNSPTCCGNNLNGGPSGSSFIYSPTLSRSGSSLNRMNCIQGSRFTR